MYQTNPKYIFIPLHEAFKSKTKTSYIKTHLEDLVEKEMERSELLMEIHLELPIVHQYPIH